MTGVIVLYCLELWCSCTSLLIWLVLCCNFVYMSGNNIVSLLLDILSGYDFLNHLTPEVVIQGTVNLKIMGVCSVNITFVQGALNSKGCLISNLSWPNGSQQYSFPPSFLLGYYILVSYFCPVINTPIFKHKKDYRHYIILIKDIYV